MAVAWDADSESHTGTTGSASQASFTWNHIPVGTPRGVLVWTFVNANADNATAVTYGGVSMSAVTGGRAVDTATEPGDVKAWFLGSNIPTGQQAVVVTRTNNANVMYATATTVTAAQDTGVHTAGIVLLQENQTLAEQSVTDGSPGTNSQRFCALNTGLATNPAVGASTTTGPGIQFGARGCRIARETTPGQGARSVGFSTATSDDVAFVALAIKEVASVTTVDVTTPGSITWAGQAVGLTTTITPAAGAVTWAGQTVTASQVTTVSVTTPGAVTWTGQTVGLKTTITPTAGAVTFAGQTVGLKTTITPTAGGITWAGQTVITGAVTTITVDTPGAITWAGQGVSLLTSLAASAGAITLTGSGVVLTNSIQPTAGGITWAGQTVSTGGSETTTINVDVPGLLTWAGQQVALTYLLSVSPGAVTVWGSDVILTATDTAPAAPVGAPPHPDAAAAHARAVQYGYMLR